MTTYDSAPEEAKKMLADLLHSYDEFKDLEEAEANIGLSWATSQEKKDGEVPPAIKWHGRPALGLARIIKLEDRVHGAPDGRITIDSRFWDTAPDNERKALLFHELYHFEVKRKDDGEIEFDDASRPRLVMRQHDVEVGWFTRTALRFGKASQECQQFRAICERDGQFLMPSLFGNEIAHNGDTLTLTRPDGTEATIPAEDLARVHAATERQLAAAAPAE